MVLHRLLTFLVLVAVTYVLGFIVLVAWATSRQFAIGPGIFIRVATHPLFCVALVIEAFVLFVLKR